MSAFRHCFCDLNIIGIPLHEVFLCVIGSSVVDHGHQSCAWLNPELVEIVFSWLKPSNLAYDEVLPVFTSILEIPDQRTQHSFGV